MKIYIILFIALSIFTIHQQAQAAVYCQTYEGKTTCSSDEGESYSCTTDQDGNTTCY